MRMQEGLLVPQGDVSRAPAAARRRSRYEGSPMLSPLPPARTAEATANATGDTPAATEAAASTAADSVRYNSKLEGALFAAKDLPSALSEPIRAAPAGQTAETTATEGSWDYTEKNGGPARVGWWQTCRRCGGGALGASEDIGRYGDLPFIRFLELLLTDETLRGDGTRSGDLQQQQVDQQQGVLQQQQHQPLEQEREQVLNGDKRVPSCPHSIFRDRTFYFASGNAVGTLFVLAADGAAAAAVVAMLLLPSTLLGAELLVAGGCAEGTIASSLKRKLSAAGEVGTCSRKSLPERCRLVSGRGRGISILD